MPADDFANKYPHLFQEVIWPWGPTRASFELLEKPPPRRLIANVNMVARFLSSGRPDLAELYQLAASVTK